MGDMAHESMESAVKRAEEDMADTSVPGTGEEAPDSQPSRDDKTDTGRPESIPYARFKEVNDQLRELKGFASVAEAGYDSDSVSRLIAFEQAYGEDPTGTVSSVIESMDLPDTTKQAIMGLLGNGEPAQTDDTDDNEPDEPPEWAKPIIEDHASRQKAEEDKFYNDLLTAGINHWKTLDEKDGIDTPDRIILRQIRASVDDGEFSTIEELAESARSELMGYREETLGSALSARRAGPRSVPGSGVPTSEPVKFDSLKEATKAAELAIQRGELPPIQPQE
jgi:hypothetical protein